jgi:hypothetical protein
MNRNYIIMYTSEDTLLKSITTPRFLLQRIRQQEQEMQASHQAPMILHRF